MPLTVSSIIDSLHFALLGLRDRTDKFPRQLAMGVLGALFGGSYMAFSGPSKKTVQTPPINASSPDEADFIQYVTRNVSISIDRKLTLE